MNTTQTPTPNPVLPPGVHDRYWRHLEQLADEIFEATPPLESETDPRMETVWHDIQDRIMDAVDASEYSLYTHKNLEVLQATDHRDAWESIINPRELVVHSTDALLAGIAFWAMRADLMDYMDRHAHGPRHKAVYLVKQATDTFRCVLTEQDRNAVLEAIETLYRRREWSFDTLKKVEPIVAHITALPALWLVRKVWSHRGNINGILDDMLIKAVQQTISAVLQQTPTKEAP